MTTRAVHDRPTLLLGAAGFLGQHVASALRASGRAVRAVSGVDLADLDAGDWNTLLGGTGGDINAAGRTAGPPDDHTRANDQLHAGALDAAARAGVPVVQFASAAEYGRTPDRYAARETDPAMPLSAYGESKLAGTILLQDAVRSGRVRACALRLTNPLGQGMNAATLPGRAAALLLGAARTRPPELHFGPLGSQRDFMDARDVARAAVHVLGLLGDDGMPSQVLPDVINVGSGVARPVRDIVQGLADLTGYRGELREDAPGSPRSGDVPYQRADLGRLHATGFTARHDLRSSL
ncbi:NAD(P)-dependent oxidoreductase, partial [Deinococcus sp.]|uniref:NAD-dependent epimerase/dehydratase family protein n=1 Tax=Deinococcus sp. TaxID=47478 RepID=UPI002869B738